AVTVRASCGAGAAHVDGDDEQPKWAQVADTAAQHATAAGDAPSPPAALSSSPVPSPRAPA
ncbi:hypothetical protein QM588_25665, partial [Rhodococcus sp. IEGM 1354]|uniref:hypothetical protein n=1 Tax=Rhodococcus sp. IEGM 1354 TaxID=3047088 RepID=UPI0024B6FADD